MESENPPDSIARVIAAWRDSRPDLEVTPIAVTARLGRLRQIMTPQLEAVFARHGVSGADFAILATITRLGGQPQSQKTLMRELNLTAGTISVRIDRLVRDGLVTRRRDESDRRGCLVAMTDEGRARFEACAPEHLENARRLTACLDEAEREQLGKLLGKLLAFLESPTSDH